jgi:L-asparaginase
VKRLKERVMNKVLIINTGGTFGMVLGEAGLAPAADLELRLREQVPELAHYSFDLVDLLPLIDSSDLRLNDWTRICETILSEQHHYAGFIVIHGTDTLAYTASALSFALLGLSQPVVVTGSQYPLGVEGSDAPTNLLDSLSYLAQPDVEGVRVCFGGLNLQANRVRKVDAQDYVAFEMPNGEISSIHEAAVPEVLGYQEGAVATLLIYPGMSAAIMDGLLTDDRLRAVVLLSFGSGNIPTTSSDFGDALRRAHEKGVLLVNMTQCLKGRVIPGAYETGALLAELGALPGFDMTPEAAFAKLHYLFAKGLDKKAVEAQWQQPLCGELQP